MSTREPGEGAGRKPGRLPIEIVHTLGTPSGEEDPARLPQVRRRRPDGDDPKSGAGESNQTPAEALDNLHWRDVRQAKGIAVIEKIAAELSEQERLQVVAGTYDDSLRLHKTTRRAVAETLSDELRPQAEFLLDLPSMNPSFRLTRCTEDTLIRAYCLAPALRGDINTARVGGESFSIDKVPTEKILRMYMEEEPLRLGFQYPEDSAAAVRTRKEIGGLHDVLMSKSGPEITAACLPYADSGQDSLLTIYLKNEPLRPFLVGAVEKLPRADLAAFYLEDPDGHAEISHLLVRESDFTRLRGGTASDRDDAIEDLRTVINIPSAARTVSLVFRTGQFPYESEERITPEMREPLSRLLDSSTCEEVVASQNKHLSRSFDADTDHAAQALFEQTLKRTEERAQTGAEITAERVNALSEALVKQPGYRERLVNLLAHSEVRSHRIHEGALSVLISDYMGFEEPLPEPAFTGDEDSVASQRAAWLQKNNSYRGMIGCILASQDDPIIGNRLRNIVSKPAWPPFHFGAALQPQSVPGCLVWKPLGAEAKAFVADSRIRAAVALRGTSEAKDLRALWSRAKKASGSSGNNDVEVAALGSYATSPEPEVVPRLVELLPKLSSAEGGDVLAIALTKRDYGTDYDSLLTVLTALKTKAKTGTFPVSAGTRDALWEFIRSDDVLDRLIECAERRVQRAGSMAAAMTTEEVDKALPVIKELIDRDFGEKTGRRPKYGKAAENAAKVVALIDRLELIRHPAFEEAFRLEVSAFCQRHRGAGERDAQRGREDALLTRYKTCSREDAAAALELISLERPGDGRPILRGLMQRDWSDAEDGEVLAKLRAVLEGVRKRHRLWGPIIDGEANAFLSKTAPEES